MKSLKNIIVQEKINILMDLFPRTYTFRGKQKSINDDQLEALSYSLYLIFCGWGLTTATNRAGFKHNVSVLLLRRMIKKNMELISSI